MSIKIQVLEEKSSIPVEIGDLKFKVYVDDQSLEKYVKEHKKIATELETIDENVTIADVKIILAKSFDFLLGEGAFERIYDRYPSVLTLADVLIQLFAQFEGEIGKLNKLPSQAEIAKQYVKAKKQKKK